MGVKASATDQQAPESTGAAARPKKGHGPAKRTNTDKSAPQPEAGPPKAFPAGATAGQARGATDGEAAGAGDWPMTEELAAAMGLEDGGMGKPEAETGGAVQRKASSAMPSWTTGAVQAVGDLGGGEVNSVATQGVANASSPLPHLDTVQHSFGAYDVSGVRAEVGGAAADASRAIGAEAYATGDRVAFASAPDLHTAAHEAAHVVQQRGGVQLKGGVGEAGDRYEQHADAVADAVVAGRSAEGLLGQMAPGPTSTGDAPASAGPVQRKTSIVDDPADPQNKTAAGTGAGLLKNSLGKIQEGVTFGPLVDGCATSMEAWLPTNDHDPDGTEPKSGTWPSWWAAAAPSPNNFWVRGHLLNHNLGGPGEPRNLTPITKTANSEHHNTVEKVLKLAAQLGGSLIGYKVVARYDGTGPTGLKGDANDPHLSVWGKLTTGFDCEYIIIVDEHDQKSFKTFVENKR
jgi:hypothetical protein